MKKYFFENTFYLLRISKINNNKKIEKETFLQTKNEVLQFQNTFFCSESQKAITIKKSKVFWMGTGHNPAGGLVEDVQQKQ